MQPWLSLPWGDKRQKARLCHAYQVANTPAFVLIDRNGHRLSLSGVEALEGDPACEKFPWDGYQHVYPNSLRGDVLGALHSRGPALACPGLELSGLWVVQACCSCCLPGWWGSSSAMSFSSGRGSSGTADDQNAIGSFNQDSRNTNRVYRSTRTAVRAASREHIDAGGTPRVGDEVPEHGCHVTPAGQHSRALIECLSRNERGRPRASSSDRKLLAGVTDG